VTFLLDVNVLIALLDADHAHSEAAHAWFAAAGRDDWATCPIVENGVVRILGSRRYPALNAHASPTQVAHILARLRNAKGHCFWPDDLSLLGNAVVDLDRLLDSADVTDTYLLALAVFHGGHLATFDRRMRTDAVRGGAEALQIIPTT
jgi:toxin-antitoxin system PIN domain toxin